MYEKQDNERRKDNGERNSNPRNSDYGGVCRSKTAVREPQNYRSTLEWLTERTGKGWLSTSEIAALLGVDRHTVSRKYEIHGGCALPILARKLCEQSK